ncbi:MAG: ISKra4 family transposase [Proteobacteria bacterium]|nr:ISKra4 family transposase [Pseudomonadota bacterium]
MTNNQLLIKSIMSEIGGEVEKFVGSVSVENDVLDDAEGMARQFAKNCGGVFFNAHIQACLKAQNNGYVGDKVETTGGGTAYFERYEKRWVLTHLGRFRISRAYYWDPKGKTGAIPLDEKWELDEREPSPALRKSIGMLSAEIPFARGRRLMKQTALVDLPEKRMQESGEALGEKIKEMNQSEARTALPMLRDPNVGIPDVLPSAQAGTLYIQMDGGRLNTTTEGWREPKVATLYWDNDVAEISKDRRLILKKEYVAVLGDADELAESLWAAACRWEWWRAKRIVVLGDGAPWIWNRASDLFPNATQILDLFHAEEHIWNTARQLYGGSGKQKDKGAGNPKKPSAKDKKTAAWAKARISELKKGNIDAIIENLDTRRPKRKEAQESVAALSGYLKENRSRMNYAQYKADGLTVGSGNIESGIKNVVNQRMKGCGMRWAVDRAENMLNLRAAYLSDVGPGNELLAAS